MSLLPTIRRVTRRIRESGPIYTLQLILNDRVPDRIWRGQKVSVWARYLTDADEKMPLDNRLRWADSSDFDFLRKAGFAENDLQARFAASCRAVILEDSGELLAASWYLPARSRPWEYFWFEFNLPQSAMWNFDVWVAPSHRGRGVGGRMLAFAHAKLRGDGRDYVYCTIDRLNRNSRSMFRKAGYQEVGAFLFLKLFRFMLVRTETSLRCARVRPGMKFFIPLHHDIVRPGPTAERPVRGCSPDVR